MNDSTGVELMTTEQLLAMPDDCIDRELIDGELREKLMPTRNRDHLRTLGIASRLIGVWSMNQPNRGEMIVGGATFRLRRDPDTTVGVDLAYITAEMVAEIPEGQRVIDGAPLLEVEILSPSDTHESVWRRALVNPPLLSRS